VKYILFGYVGQVALYKPGDHSARHTCHSFCWVRRMYYVGQAATIEFKLARTKWAKFRKAKLILCRSTAYSAGGNVPFRDLLPSCLTGFVLGVLLLHRMKAQLRPLKRRDV
jgi:hypothetical protein